MGTKYHFQLCHLPLLSVCPKQLAGKLSLIVFVVVAQKHGCWRVFRSKLIYSEIVCILCSSWIKKKWMCSKDWMGKILNINNWKDWTSLRSDIWDLNKKFSVVQITKKNLSSAFISKWTIEFKFYVLLFGLNRSPFVLRGFADWLYSICNFNQARFVLNLDKWLSTRHWLMQIKSLCSF